MSILNLTYIALQCRLQPPRIRCSLWCARAAWLASLEAGMRGTLRAMIKQEVKAYPTESRCKWALAQPSQLALTVASIHWCQNITAMLASGTALGQMKAYVEEIAAQLAELAEVASGALTPLQRCAVVALMTSDVHSRDVVARLVTSRCSSPSDFAWQSQLRCVLSRLRCVCQLQASDAVPAAISTQSQRVRHNTTPALKAPSTVLHPSVAAGPCLTCPAM